MPDSVRCRLLRRVPVRLIGCVICTKLTVYSPLKAAWDANPTYPYKCFNTDIFLFACGIINTLTDFLCTVMPAFIILKLHMPFRKRMGVASLFFIGIIVNVASALRIYFLANEVETGSDTWNTLPPAVCSNLELGLGLVSFRLQSPSQSTPTDPSTSCASISRASDPLSVSSVNTPFLTCVQASATASSIPATQTTRSLTTRKAPGTPFGVRVVCSFQLAMAS